METPLPFDVCVLGAVQSLRTSPSAPATPHPRPPRQFSAPSHAVRASGFLFVPLTVSCSGSGLELATPHLQRPSSVRRFTSSRPSPCFAIVHPPSSPHWKAQRPCHLARPRSRATASGTYKCVLEGRAGSRFLCHRSAPGTSLRPATVGADAVIVPEGTKPSPHNMQDRGPSPQETRPRNRKPPAGLKAAATQRPQTRAPLVHASADPGAPGSRGPTRGRSAEPGTRRQPGSTSRRRGAPPPAPRRLSRKPRGPVISVVAGLAPPAWGPRQRRGLGMPPASGPPGGQRPLCLGPQLSARPRTPVRSHGMLRCLPFPQDSGRPRSQPAGSLQIPFVQSPLSMGPQGPKQ